MLEIQRVSPLWFVSDVLAHRDRSGLQSMIEERDAVCVAERLELDPVVGERHELG